MKKLVLLLSLFFLVVQVYAAVNSQQANITGLNQFAFNYYQQIAAENNNNIAISPFGISSLLNILYAGSAGKTQQEIGNALGLSSQNNNFDINSLTQTFTTQPACPDKYHCRWVSLIPASSNTSQFIYGNALWLQSGTVLTNSFAQRFNNLNAGQTYFVDFINRPKAAVDAINKWVANLTHNYIRKLISIDLITNQTRIVATNAIYFKGLWQKAFDPSQTQPGPFILDNGKSINIPMMNIESNSGYAENTRFKILVLPYKNSTLAMAILLPQKTGNFNQFVKSLNLKIFMALAHNLSDTDLNITMPKFIIQTSLNAIENNLNNMGIKQAFTPLADFSPMTTSTQVMLSKVIQKVYVGVDEKGTIATAATGAMMVGSAAVSSQEFKADHPFVFIIYDTKSNLILFMGNVMDPSS